MARFCDSSALVKRYVTETGTAWVRGLFTPGATVYVAEVTAAEVTAALARRERGGGLSPADGRAARAQFRYDYPRDFERIATSRALIESAMDVADRHALRGYDAVQLASALEAQAVCASLGLPPLTLVTADRELLAAAAAEGLATEDPNAHP